LSHWLACGSVPAMKASALGLRERVLRARGQGRSAHDVARQLSLSKRSVERYRRRYQDTGQATARKMGGHRTSRLAPHDTTLRAGIGQRPDLTLGELQRRCREELPVRLGITALWHRLERLGLSDKKNAARRRANPARAAGRARPLVAAAGAVGRPPPRVPR
jgi:transposase